MNVRSAFFTLSIAAVLLISLLTIPIPSTTYPIQAQAGNYPNCRLGVGVVREPISSYNVQPMNFGWYYNWTAPLAPVKPFGMDFYHTLRVKQDKSESVYLQTYQITPTLSMNPGELGPIVQANPGAVWLIGNEIDRVVIQDETTPQMYARIYHDAYTFIKGIDPTAKIAIGSIVQPTPLRLQYLDLVINTYRELYGTHMPVDMWNIHLYILQEKKNGPGAEIPPGITATQGILYTTPDHMNIEIFKDLIRDMRTWMKSRGYQDSPLILTEFGVLLPLWYLDDFGYGPNHIYQFNKNAIDFINTAVDVNLGYPADGYRLMQQGALYSLDDDSTDAQGFLRWGTILFTSTSPYTITAMGTFYRDSIAGPIAASVDLMPGLGFSGPAPLIVAPGGSVTTTFTAPIANAGNTAPSNSGVPLSTTVRFYDVTGGGNALLGQKTLAAFTGCGSTRAVSVTWPALTEGWHAIRVDVDPGGSVAEINETNNVITTTVFVGTQGIYLPNVQR